MNAGHVCPVQSTARSPRGGGSRRILHAIPLVLEEPKQKKRHATGASRITENPYAEASCVSGVMCPRWFPSPISLRLAGFPTVVSLRVSNDAANYRSSEIRVNVFRPVDNSPIYIFACVNRNMPHLHVSLLRTLHIFYEYGVIQTKGARVGPR